VITWGLPRRVFFVAVMLWCCDALGMLYLRLSILRGNPGIETEPAET